MEYYENTIPKKPLTVPYAHKRFVYAENEDDDVILGVNANKKMKIIAEEDPNDNLRTFYQEIREKEKEKKNIENKNNSENDKKGTDDNENTVYNEDDRSRSDSELSNKQYFCERCNDHFSDMKEDHIKSPAHLFNLQYEPAVHFDIPQHNKGYKIMREKLNWDGEKGLGKEQQGRLFPVPTVLKKDRLGLGNPNEDKARITHSDPAKVNAPIKSRKYQKKDEDKKNKRRRKTLSQKKREAAEQKRASKSIHYAVYSDLDLSKYL
jgi:hypothetical protein